jgi:hypothetical protein
VNKPAVLRPFLVADVEEDREKVRKIKPRLILKDFRDLEKFRFTGPAASGDSTST